jgi:hypothetical protein
VFPVKYELAFCIPEDDILHSDCRENLKSYVIIVSDIWQVEVNLLNVFTPALSTLRQRSCLSLSGSLQDALLTDWAV